MPIVQQPHVTPVLYYDAPVNEKTKQIREMFNVDEKTGYPKHYNWRPMAKLGSEYRPEEPLLKLNSYDPDRNLSRKYMTAFVCTALCVSGQLYINFMSGRTLWARPKFLLIAVPTTTFVANWLWQHTVDRQGMKAAIMIDYLKKHPDRFDTIRRYKYRETLITSAPCR